MKTFAIFPGGRSKAAHSNRQAHARGTQGRSRARLRSEDSSSFYEFIISSFFVVGSHHDEAQFFRRGAAGGESPPVHAEGPGQGDERLFLLRGAGARAQTLAPFLHA